MNFQYKGQLQDKRRFNLYSRTEECPLTASENLVLSYLIHVEKFNMPNKVQVERWTGLSQKPVDNALNKICLQHEVLGMERNPVPESWHYTFTGKTGEYWRRKGSIDFYTPARGGPLSVYDAIVWAWVYNQFSLQRTEYATRYIAKCVGLNPRTVADSLAKLQSSQVQLLRMTDGVVEMPEQLADWQLKFFADKGKDKPTLGFFTPIAPPTENQLSPTEDFTEERVEERVVDIDQEHPVAQPVSQPGPDWYLDLVNLADARLESVKGWHNRERPKFIKRVRSEYISPERWEGIISELESQMAF